MKKLLACGLLALLATVATERPAQAWVNSKFSIGLNWHFQSANNNLLWGLFRNGQNPYFDSGFDPSSLNNSSAGYGYGMGGYGLTATTPASPTAATAPATAPSTVPITNTPASGAQTWQYNANPSWYANPYQTVGYNPSAYYSGYYTPPSYWYGR